MKRLEYLLREQGITQAEIAEKAGIHRMTVNKIIHGREKPWPKWRDAIATALDWPLDRAEELFQEIEVK